VAQMSRPNLLVSVSIYKQKKQGKKVESSSSSRSIITSATAASKIAYVFIK